MTTLRLSPDQLAISNARLPFAEQIAFFRHKLGHLIPTERWTDVMKSAHDRGFMVAGAQKADLLSDFAMAVDSAIAEGKSLGWFRQAFDAIVDEHGWAYRGERNWRTRVIYRTNMATSYAAGRLAQLRDPRLQQLKPYWMYVHSDSVIYPRPLHVSWHGLTLPADHPWFQTHYPPNGWGCQCSIVAVSKEEAERLGGRVTDTPPDDGYWTAKDGSRVPNGIDYGWDYMPGATVTEEVWRSVGNKIASLPASLGAELAAATLPLILERQVKDFQEWADAIVYPRGEIKQVGAISTVVMDGMEKRGIVPSSAAIAIRDYDVVHAHRGAKIDALPWSWYRELPRHVAAPSAVLLDKTDPKKALLLVFDIEGVTGKLVLKLDYEIEVRGADGIRRPAKVNILRSGKIIPKEALYDRTAYEVLEGNL